MIIRRDLNIAVTAGLLGERGVKSMRIVTLMENTAVSGEFVSSHGLSFYIETRGHRILFDMGQDGGFLENAKKLGVDIGSVDLAVLSHGHYDHGGGIAAFLEANSRAEIHIQKKALGEFYAHDTDGSSRYIGLPKQWMENPRVVTHTGDYKLDAGIQIFAGVTGRECYSPANDRLFFSMNGRHIPDLFMHEQNLLLKEGDRMVLFAGCAHNGMVNIVKKAETFAPSGIQYVIGGMHLMKAYPQQEKQKMFCKSMADKLKEHPCQYYTCHCTSVESYEMLREEMGSQINYLSAGSILEI